MPARNLLLLGITGDLAFAAGALILAARRHSPRLDLDILVYSDASLREKDKALLQKLGARAEIYHPPENALPPAFLNRYSPLALARFEALRLLETHHNILWLDADTAVQDDISPLFAAGPLALAPEDPNFSPTGKAPKARVNLIRQAPRFDRHAPNYNSGVMAVSRALKDPAGLYTLCLNWLKHYADHFHFVDQGLVNMLAQHVAGAGQLAELPCDRYNAHPRNPGAALAVVVHAFGPYKLWSDARLMCLFPEWTRDYRRWLALGGTPYTGEVRRPDFCPGGPLEIIARADQGKLS